MSSSSASRGVGRETIKAIRRVISGRKDKTWTIHDSNAALAKRRHARAIARFRGPRKPLPYIPPEAPTIPKLPPGGPAIHPKPLTPMPSSSSATAAHTNAQASSKAGGGAAAGGGAVANRAAAKGGGKTGEGGGSSYSTRLKAWLRQNASVLVLNFGSICTLTGFTRKDVLELRILSVTGSLSSIFYFATATRPIAWVPLAWSSIFALTNAFNIHAILDERSHRVVLSDEEENIFVEHFMPHGVTPKQFKRVYERATVVKLPKKQTLHTQGEPINHVYLVVKGQTRGSALGRYLTAASSAPGNSNTLRGGDAGAWIGEMVFLERYWAQNHPPKPLQKFVSSKDKKPTTTVEEQMVEDEDDPEVKEDEEATESERRYTAMYTITAKDDCELLQWSHEELDKILSSSTDMRSAMTRAMTAAVVGKVVNFTVSRSSGTSKWSSWLKDWKSSGGASINVRSEIGGRRMSEKGKVDETSKTDIVRKQIEQLATQ